MPNEIISEKTLEQAKALLEEGRVSESWATLGAAGDEYAVGAAEVTSKEPSLLQSVTKAHWDNVVGNKVRQEKRAPTAKQHLGQYIDEVERVPSQLPDSRFIENSYRKSVVDNGLPPEVAIDLTYNRLVSQLR